MPRTGTLRIAAAVFVFCSSSALAVAPASAQPTGVTTESGYARVLRSINPALTLAKARAYARSVMADAWRTHLDPRFIMSIVTVEAHWNANATSRHGAEGLGQLMPRTAARLGVNARNPAQNLRGTSAYLESLVAHSAGRPNAVKLAIAGYNAGPRAVERYHGIPPYAETQAYVVRVLHVWNVLDARVGRAFAVAPHAAARIAVRRAEAVDEEQWTTDAATVLPAQPATLDEPTAAQADAGAAPGSP